MSYFCCQELIGLKNDMGLVEMVAMKNNLDVQEVFEMKTQASDTLSLFFRYFLPQVEVSPLPWYFTVLHNDPAAPQNHYGRCRIRTRDFCTRSLVRYQWASIYICLFPHEVFQWAPVMYFNDYCVGHLGLSLLFYCLWEKFTLCIIMHERERVDMWMWEKIRQLRQIPRLLVIFKWLFAVYLKLLYLFFLLSFSVA